MWSSRSTKFRLALRCSCRRQLPISEEVRTLTSLVTSSTHLSLPRTTARRWASSSSSSLRVGFIGLGNMGLPMALNLIKKKEGSGDAGGISVSSVVAFDTNQNACQTLLDQQKQQEGATSVEVVKKVGDVGAAGCDAIITMLPGCKAVDAVMQEIYEGLSNSSISLSPSSSHFQKVSFIDCSTVAPTTSANWQEFWEGEAHSMHDAPVSGGVKGATAGTLTFMVGSPHVKAEFNNDPKVIVRPLLECMGKRIVLCGGPGAGSATKLCNNLALAAQMAGVCEALNLGESLGVDPVVLADVLNTSTAACWSSKVNNPHPAVAKAMAKDNNNEGPPAARHYKGGFGSKLMLKDLGLAVAAAEEAGVAIPVAAVSKELYRLATLRGMGEQDFGVLLEFLKGM